MGTVRLFEHCQRPEVFSARRANQRPAHKPVTQTVSPPDDYWSNELERNKIQRSNQLDKIGCIILVAIPLVIMSSWFISPILHRFPPKSIFVADQNEPSDVALAFAYSLPFNKMSEMKSYVVQDKWNFIENWAENHAPISEKCHYPSDPDFWGTMMFGGDDNGGSSSVSLFYTYDCPGYGYWFDLGGLELRLIDEKWWIVDWDEICEERGSGRRCLDGDTFVWRSG